MKTTLWAILLAGLLSPPLSVAGSEEVQVIHVTARKFAFELDRDTVQMGRPVEFVIRSADRLHGFNLPASGQRVDVLRGQEARLRHTPRSPGQLPFFCDIFCGSGHERMQGEIRVVE